MLSLLGERKFTQVDLQCVMKWTTKLINQTIRSTLSSVSEVLETSGCNDSQTLKRMIEVYSSDTCMPQPFSGLRTQHMQKKEFVERFGMLQPVLIDLPSRPEAFGRIRTNTSQKIPKETYAIVPLIPQLKVLLNKKDVHRQVFGEKTHISGVFSRFEDGSAFRDSPFFQAHPKALQIHLYLDEVQIVDAIGKKVFKNKMVFVYFTIGNLESKYRSCLNHIHLLAIFPNRHVASYGLNLLLKPIIDEIKLLEDGVDMVIHEETIKVYGTLAVLTADNLASHAVGGFKAGFSKGFRKCRYCLAVDAEIQTKFCDGQFEARTKTGHNLHCSGLETDLHEYFGKLYGINGKSVLNELKFFHVIGGLVPDIMHDLHEGVLSLMLCKILKYCITKKYFTLDQLNKGFQNFKYGHAEVKNKPSLIFKQHLNKNKINQSAAQTSLMANALPLLVSGFIPPYDKKWLCFTTLLEISRIITSHSVAESEILMLEFLISDFLTSYKECFPSERITPKMHFLVHYPRYIRLMGPLGAFWCMRYEAKHSYFKQIARVTGNYINPPWTLAYRHQVSQCQHFYESGENCLNVKIDTPAKVTFAVVGELNCFAQIASSLSIVDMKQTIKSFSWIQYGSTVYKTFQKPSKKNTEHGIKKDFCDGNTMVLCPMRGNIDAAFGKIIGIYSHNNSFVFLCQMYRTIQFDTHMQAYELCKRADNLKIAVKYEELLDYKVYHLHSPMQFNLNTQQVSKEFISPKTDLSMFQLTVTYM